MAERQFQTPSSGKVMPLPTEMRFGQKQMLSTETSEVFLIHIFLFSLYLIDLIVV